MRKVEQGVQTTYESPGKSQKLRLIPPLALFLARDGKIYVESMDYVGALLCPSLIDREHMRGDRIGRIRLYPHPKWM